MKLLILLTLLKKYQDRYLLRNHDIIDGSKYPS